MLSDASKWEQQESDGKLQKNRQSGISTLPVVISFRPISTYKQSSAVKQRSLAELKNGIRELCSNAYNLSTFSSSSDSARQMLRILEGITGWNVIRREAAIASSIKHQMAVLDNLQAFDWGSTTQTSSTASSPSKLRIHLPFHPKDLLESIEVLKMRLAQINEVFGDHCDVLPNWQ